ncbi:MAG: hypothetical protein M3P18_08205 [Actinomycetota bacterium]|nr:hypothetical protein [Actinomycetota bacterium]
MQQQQSYAVATRQIAASLTMDRERTLRDVARVDADVLERSRGVAVRIGASADVPLGEAIDVERTATLAAAASLLCQAHESPDRLLFAEAEMLADRIGSMLDESAAAYRAGDPKRMQTLQTKVGIALGEFTDLIRSAA